MTKKYGPWIALPDGKRPEHLKGHQRIQPLCISMNGMDVQTDMLDRAVCNHVWCSRTLAYRVVIETKTHVVYGGFGRSFVDCRYPDDTHKITYETEDGVVVSCKMEAM